MRCLNLIGALFFLGILIMLVSLNSREAPEGDWASYTTSANAQKVEINRADDREATIAYLYDHERTGDAVLLMKSPPLPMTKDDIRARVEAGTAIYVRAGTEAKRIGALDRLYQIEITNGEYVGEVGFVDPEYWHAKALYEDK
jgi:hypothetical protein